MLLLYYYIIIFLLCYFIEFKQKIYRSFFQIQGVVKHYHVLKKAGVKFQTNLILIPSHM